MTKRIKIRTGIPALDTLRINSLTQLRVETASNYKRFGYCAGVLVTVGPRGAIYTNHSPGYYLTLGQGSALVGALENAEIISKGTLKEYTEAVSAKLAADSRNKAAQEVIRGTRKLGIKLTKAQRTKVLAALTSEHGRKYWLSRI